MFLQGCQYQNTTVEIEIFSTTKKVILARNYKHSPRMCNFDTIFSQFIFLLAECVEADKADAGASDIPILLMKMGLNFV